MPKPRVSGATSGVDERVASSSAHETTTTTNLSHARRRVGHRQGHRDRERDGRAPNFRAPVEPLVRYNLGSQADPDEYNGDGVMLLGMIGVERERIMSAEIDTSVSLIGVCIPHPDDPNGRDTLLIIDGWHRIAKAYRTRFCLCASETCTITHLNVHVLSEEEERKVHIRGPALGKPRRRTQKG